MKRLVAAAAVILALGRLGLAVYSGTIFQSGGSDFEMNLPAGFLDPAQPPAPSLAAAVREPWTMPSYPRGPAQFLTIVPLALIGPYERFSLLLLSAGTLLIVAVALVMRQVIRRASGTAVSWIWPLLVTCWFTPVTDALVGREFEIVIATVFALAALALTHDRGTIYGALLAYAALYKYMPLIAVPYLAIRRFWSALGGFIAGAALLLGLAHAAFGLDRFINNNVGTMAINRLSGFTSTAAFCDLPTQVIFTHPPLDDEDSVRADLCRWNVPAPGVIYLLLAASIAGVVAYATHRFQLNVRRAPGAELWRRLLELSLLIVIATTFFYSQYYHLTLLTVPMIVVLARLNGVAGWSPLGLVWWCVAYFLLAQFLMPAFMVERLFDQHLHLVYQQTPARLIGELILIALILRQYVMVSTEDRRA